MNESKPETQTIQLDADSDEATVNRLIAQALRRARIGGTTLFFDGDDCVAKLTPSIETLLELGSLGSEVARTIRKQSPPGMRRQVHTDQQNEPLRREIEQLINRYSRENESNTPDFLLAAFLTSCLIAWEETTKLRDRWFGAHLVPGETYVEG